MKYFNNKGTFFKLGIFVFVMLMSIGSSAQVATFSASTSTSGEAAGIAVVTVVLDAPAPTATVDYSVTGGSATGSGVDYTLASGTVSFAGGPFQFFFVNITNDVLHEIDESVVITLSNPVNCILGNGTATQPIEFTLVIQDDDSAPTVQFNSVTSNGLESVTPANFRVELSAVSGTDVNVDYTVTGSATGGGTDYTLVDGTLTIPAGATFADISAIINDDALLEGDETIVVTLSNPVEATLGANTVHTYTINDNDSPVVNFLGSSTTTNEGISIGIFFATISAATPTATVDYSVTGGTATGGGVDYTLASGTFDFATGTLQNTFVTIVNDLIHEADETILITLSNPVNCVLGDGSASQPIVFTFIIEDNDVAPTIQFASVSSNGLESVTPANFRVELSTVSGVDANVDYTITGTATGGGTDYTLADGTLTIPAGATFVDISAIINDDALLEGDETIVLTLSNPVEATLGANTVHTYTINDNDSPVVNFLGSATTAGEGVSPGIVFAIISASAPTATVDYTVTGGTATGGGVDYTLANGTFDFSTGTVQNFLITVINDVINEADETIIITLSNPVNCVLGDGSPGQPIVFTYTILDDDTPAVYFLGSSTTGNEGISPGLVAGFLSASEPTATVDYTVTGGTATGGGVDYTLAAGTFSFATSQVDFLSIAIIDDLISEADETIIITLSNPMNCVLGDGSGSQPIVFTYIIQDNDTPLPVELISFDATNENNTVSLDWKTASEIDNDFFSVERSSNGVDFFEIGQVAGNGTTNELQTYNFVDKSPLNGVSYYRLRQVDYDGAFEYSNVADVSIALANFAFNVYPNPIENHRAIIEMRNVGEGDASISVYNSVGKVVLNKTVALNPNQSLKYDLELERNTPTGIYIVEVRSGKNRYIRKVVIQ